MYTARADDNCLNIWGGEGQIKSIGWEPEDKTIPMTFRQEPDPELNKILSVYSLDETGLIQNQTELFTLCL